MRFGAGFAVAIMLAALAACAPEGSDGPREEAGATAGPAVDPAAPQAASPTLVAARGPDAGPPLTDGLYIDTHSACPWEACVLERIRFEAPAALFDRPGGATPVDEIDVGEWANVVNAQYRAQPQRGVVHETKGQFVAGDVIFLLTPEGEGCSSAWRRGEMLGWCFRGDGPSDFAIVSWDPPPSPPPGAGLWIEVARDGGGRGWVHEPEKIACASVQDRDGCPPLKE